MLDGVVAGSLALMAVVAWQLGKAAIVDIPTLLIPGSVCLSQRSKVITELLHEEPLGTGDRVGIGDRRRGAPSFVEIGLGVAGERVGDRDGVLDVSRCRG